MLSVMPHSIINFKYVWPTTSVFLIIFNYQKNSIIYILEKVDLPSHYLKEKILRSLNQLSWIRYTIMWQHKSEVLFNYLFSFTRCLKMCSLFLFVILYNECIFYKQAKAPELEPINLGWCTLSSLSILLCVIHLQTLSCTDRLPRSTWILSIIMLQIFFCNILFFPVFFYSFFL